MNRRLFLSTATLASGSLMVGIKTKANAFSPSTIEDFQPNRLLIFQKDGIIRLITNKTEMGQGTNSSIALLAAEELCVPLEWIHQEVRIPDKEGFVGTGGSWGMAGYYRGARPIFATARQLFVNAAGKYWSVNPTQVTVKDGHFIHPDKAESLTYTTLLELASRLEIPEEAPLISPQEFKYIGRSYPHAHLEQQLNGTLTYGIDQQVEGMLYASIERCPVTGGKLRRLNSEAALSFKGVKAVIPLEGTDWEAYDYFPAGVAVLATNSWAAQRGRHLLEIEWVLGGNQKLNNAFIQRHFSEKLDEEGVVFYEKGTESSPPEMETTLTAIYDTPFWSHSPMEPMNTLAHYTEQACEIWTPCHMQSRLLAAVKKLTGFSDHQIKIHTTYLGGSFGRRLLVDYALEALLLSKACGKPVQLLNTRIDETKQGHYMPAGKYRLESRIKDGRPTSLKMKVVSLSIYAQREPDQLKGGVDHSIGDDFLRYPYEIPQLQYEQILANEIQIPALWWRGTFANTAGFVMESWIDELAHATKADPLDFRLSLLQKTDSLIQVRGEEMMDRSIFRKVLEEVTKLSNWKKKRQEHHGKGVAACFTFFESYAAIVAEVSVTEKKLHIRKLSCVVECGQVVNPNLVRAQVEGGIVFALSAMLKASINFEGGRVVEHSFGDYPTLTYEECPEIEILLLPSDRPACGVGELSNIPTFAAVTNAIFDACGLRVRSLPLSKHLEV
ncbi:MAG: xanthine dehydrogenase family protein molybdopterin-binding subunit [Cyanothece sp. SIO1E1]|nr:xanthine dehydrogenase family protein molybdopterin-binding subunit [Cyanothece sp. SIO1E1]